MKMVSQTIIIKNAEGLHARPATEIAKNATKYTSTVELDVMGNKFNAKSVLNIMSAGIKNSTQIQIICDGVDEEKALEEVLQTFKENSLV